MGWPKNWKDMIHHVYRMTRDEFIDVLTVYCQDREKGDKHHLRHTDKLARSGSPMMLYRKSEIGLARNDNKLIVVKYRPHAGVVKW
jgi:hypothetical protein